MSAHPGTSTHGSHNLYSFQTHPLKVRIIEPLVGQNLEKQSPQTLSEWSSKHLYLVRIVPTIFSSNQEMCQNQFMSLRLVTCSFFFELCLVHLIVPWNRPTAIGFQPDSHFFKVKRDSFQRTHSTRKIVIHADHYYYKVQML